MEQRAIIASPPFVAGLMLLLFSSCLSGEQRLDKAFEKSAQWLWHQQSADGGWHSTTHTILADGSALTPYILYYLLQVPETICPRPAASVQRAVEFIRRDMYHSLTIGPDSMAHLNYPNYSAAYALRILIVLQQDTALQNLIEQHLWDEQYTEQRGIDPNDLAYGAWGYGEPGIAPGKHGHIDLSHTRRVLEALTDKRADKKMTREERQRRLNGVSLFLQGVQRSTKDPRLYEGCTSRHTLPYDGGFIYSSVTLAANKSQPVNVEGAGIHYPSYATATCDGLLALHALGLDSTSAFREARQWLASHQRIDVVEGLSPRDPEQWYIGMRYYHWAVRAEAMIRARIEGPWKKNLRQALIREQQFNGYYLNPLGGINKENDPLLATIFAVEAMTLLH